MKLKVKDRKKFNRFLLLTFLLFTIVSYLLISMINQSVAKGFQNKLEYKEIVVKNGDTLWSIAESLKEDKDIRETVYEIKKLNGIKSDELFIGDKLIIPVK
ncbi:MAG: LysM peptidoglycan-binding domain-containing protein [Tissierellia bacterium]|nr:LysM peptidoglycan-binding domain-containing protein [Tissierellia bacterium]